MATSHDLFNGPPQQDDIFGNSNQQHEEDASSLFGGSAAASGPSFFDQLATPPNGHHDFPGGSSNFHNTPAPPAKMVSPSSFTTPAQQMQPSAPQQFNSFSSAAPPSHLQQSPAGPQPHQATPAHTTPAAAAPPPASPTHSAAASPAASNLGNFNQFSTPAPQQQNGEELPADIFASSGDAFFDSLGGPSAIASSPANDFFAAAAQHQQPSPFSPSHPIAAPSQPSTHAHLSSSPSPAAASSYASSPSAPSSFPSAPPGGGAYPSATHQHPATQYGSPGGPQQPYQPQAPHQQHYQHPQYAHPQYAHPQYAHPQHPASSQYPHQHTQPGASEAAPGAPYGQQPHHPYGSVPSPATVNAAAGAGGPVSVFTPTMPQAPGSQGRSTASAQQHPGGGINPYPQPPATAPVPFMGRGPAGGAGPGFPTPPGSSGGAATTPSATPTGAGSVAFNLGNGSQASAGGFQSSATPTPPGTGGTGQFTTFVPRPAQPVGQPTPAGPSPYGGAPSPYATGGNQSPVGPGSSIPLNRLSTSASALPQKPQVDAYGRTMLTQSSPAPQPGPGGYLQPAGGQPGGYQAPGYGPYSPHQHQGHQHHRNRSVSLQPNPLQLSDLPRVASNPEFARYGVMSPPGSGVPAHLAHNLSYLNSMPAMPPSMGNPQYGYPGGQPDNGYGGPYGGQQQNGGYGGQQAGWGDMSSSPMGQYAPAPYGMQQQPQQDRLLFDRPHAVATFGFGGKLFTLIPRQKRKLNVYQPQEVDTQSDGLLQGPLKVMPVNEILGKTSFLTTFTSFPGPLKNASKDAVNKYVSNKASGASESEDAMADPEATQLLWSLLRVMCTHYGDLSQQDALKEVRQALLEGINPTDYNAASAAASSPLSGPALEAAVKQVELLLLSGEREKACHAAMEAGLWGHALFLASHLNPQLYQTVCKRFAQSSISEGSPLQTLYLLLAKCPQEMLKSLQGSGGSSGTAVDRWRENLAVILANRMQGDVKVIGQLGDMLWSTQMRVAAAHFCYLVAETPFGPFENPNTRLILIGGDHKTQARLFVSPESVQRTEVFEYAKALGNSQYTLPTFQVYKFIYAATLADLGLLQQASNYYQSISAVVKDHAGTCSPAFLAQLHAFGDRISTIAPASRTAALAPPGWLSGLVQKGLSALIGDEKNSPAAGGAAASTEKIDVQASATVSAPGPASVPMVSVVTGGTGGQQPGIPSVGGPSPVMYNPSTAATMMNPASMPMMNPASVPMMMNPSSGPASSSPYHQPQPVMHNPASAHFGAPGGAPDFNGVSYHSQPQPQPADDFEEEDLMKSAFTKPKPGDESRPGTPSSVSMDKNGGSAQTNGGQKDKPADDKSGGDPSGAGFWGRLGGLGLFRKKPTGKEMKLGQTENEFVYNEELGIWHEKGKPPPKEERGHSAPPPIMGAGPSGSGSPFPSAGGYPSGPAPLSGPDGGNQFTKYASPAARGNRRYVDTFNPEPAPGSTPAAAPMSVPTPSLMMPTPGMHPSSPATSAPYTVFTPPMSPYQPQQ